MDIDKDCQGLLYFLHMSTINISLPLEQVNFVDKLVDSYRFANRSEFIRSLLRLVSFRPEMVQNIATFPFVIPGEKSARKIIEDFKSTKKYSAGFLKDLKEGLSQSDYFRE